MKCHKLFEKKLAENVQNYDKTLNLQFQGFHETQAEYTFKNYTKV